MYAIRSYYEVTRPGVFMIRRWKLLGKQELVITSYSIHYTKLYEYFYKHFGFNPVAMLHAFQQNRAAGKVVRGGSTLTQQVMRLHRKNAERSYFEKLLEVILATVITSYSIHYTKLYEQLKEK